jgi:hypothetical protein
MLVLSKTVIVQYMLVNGSSVEVFMPRKSGDVCDIS